MTETLDWRDARCREVGVELFYVERAEGKAAREADHDVQAEDPNEVRAKVCRECPLKRPCLEYALEHEEQYGIWGGMTPRQRLAIIRARKGQPRFRWSQRSVNEDFVLKFCNEGHAIEGSNVFVDHRGNKVCRTCYEDDTIERHRKEREKENSYLLPDSL